MSSANDVKRATTYFPIQPDDIHMNEFGTGPMPLRIIKFQKYLQKYAINIPTNGKALGLLVTVLDNNDYENVNNNQTWVAPTNLGTEPVLPTAFAEGALTRSAS